MIGISIEALTPRTADLVPRRTSLQALTSVALGGLAAPSLVEAKMGKLGQKKVDKTCKRLKNDCASTRPASNWCLKFPIVRSLVAPVVKH
jgi:hypothetical protein